MIVKFDCCVYDPDHDSTEVSILLNTEHMVHASITKNAKVVKVTMIGGDYVYLKDSIENIQQRLLGF